MTVGVENGLLYAMICFLYIYLSKCLSCVFQTLSVCAEWVGLHHFASGRRDESECPCTGLAVRADEDFVSVGEDGRISLMNLEQ